ncbi:MAG: hypothetical protein UT33_C0005G0138 [Candidatus Peregrinibacteria bacterium GW2011_GWC2_39_14]|nr:MAG: hypothetical protein US92_C0001G0139 [Candidatus Peregrinibacteria bacterium GW2011_GWA2_38_36]KKR07194.1 MAG: hypothetical protein UT33_C0005G0138 [Candidatus Peregrinibacteria bacterium GW2011_GWC2_39_14]
MPTCLKCQQPFEITQGDLDFYSKLSVPAPTSCPDCRWIRRLIERNTRTLYKRKCDFSGEEMISQYHENQPFPVYHWKVWWSDKWDATKYARPFDFNKPFFLQFHDLKNVTPHLSAFVIGETMTNSLYTNCAGYLKNCYMTFEADYDEDCYYCNRLYYSQNCMDCLSIYKSELCYEAIDCQNCYNLKYSTDCETCSESYFLNNCKSCKNCIGCINLRHKQYHIFNKEYSKRDYEKQLAEFDFQTLANIAKFRKQAEEFFQTQPHKNLQQEHNENSLGDYLYDSKNAEYCFDCKDLEDCKYVGRVAMQAKNCMDYSGWGDKAELLYECAACGNNAYNLKFCTTCTTNNSNLEYCDHCTGCKDCFGCVGLKRKKFCILNQEYSEEEYKDLRARIIVHMQKSGQNGEAPEYGQFFPIEICPFAYNESLVMEVFPKTHEEALKQGFKWLGNDARFTPQTFRMPERIADVKDSVMSELLACKFCGKNFKLIEQELKFYRALNIPAPISCPNCRHFSRLATRNPKQLFESKCDKCSKKIMTSYKEKSSPIYCEECYTKHVFTTEK